MTISSRGLWVRDFLDLMRVRTDNHTAAPATEGPPQEDNAQADAALTPGPAIPSGSVKGSDSVPHSHDEVVPAKDGGLALSETRDEQILTGDQEDGEEAEEPRPSLSQQSVPPSTSDSVTNAPPVEGGEPAPTEEHELLQQGTPPPTSHPVDNAPAVEDTELASADRQDEHVLTGETTPAPETEQREKALSQPSTSSASHSASHSLDELRVAQDDELVSEEKQSDNQDEVDQEFTTARATEEREPVSAPTQATPPPSQSKVDDPLTLSQPAMMKNLPPSRKRGIVGEAGKDVPVFGAFRDEGKSTLRGKREASTDEPKPVAKKRQKKSEPQPTPLVVEGSRVRRRTEAGAAWTASLKSVKGKRK